MPPINFTIHGNHMHQYDECISITISHQVRFSSRVSYLNVNPLPYESLVSVHQAVRLVMAVLSTIVGHYPQWIQTSSGTLISSSPPWPNRYLSSIQRLTNYILMQIQEATCLLRNQAHLESMEVAFDFNFEHVNFSLLDLSSGPNTRKTRDVKVLNLLRRILQSSTLDAKSWRRGTNSQKLSYLFS